MATVPRHIVQQHELCVGEQRPRQATPGSLAARNGVALLPDFRAVARRHALHVLIQAASSHDTAVACHVHGGSVGGLTEARDVVPQCSVADPRRLPSRSEVAVTHTPTPGTNTGHHARHTCGAYAAVVPSLQLTLPAPATVMDSTDVSLSGRPVGPRRGGSGTGSSSPSAANSKLDLPEPTPPTTTTSSPAFTPKCNQASTNPGPPCPSLDEPDELAWEPRSSRVLSPATPNRGSLPRLRRPSWDDDSSLLLPAEAPLVWSCRLYANEPDTCTAKPW